MINEKLLKQAIEVLKNLNEKHFEDSSKKKPLLDDEKGVTVYLQVSLKKIPKCKSIQMIKVNLPHSLLKDNSEVCLITGDLDKKTHKAEIEPDILHYKELLKKHDIDCISEVVTLRQLRTDYKPYEAKQKLLAAYDVFLADSKIVECLPKVLGRHFFKKRKLPIRVTMNTANLKQQVEKALSTKVFYLTGHGNSCNSEVGHLDMKNTEISENVKTMAKALCEKLPGSWENIMGIYLKTALSKAVPVYLSYDDPNKVHLEEVKDDNSFEMDELSTHPNGLVKVFKDGNVRYVQEKRMAETEICETNGDTVNEGDIDIVGDTIDDSKETKNKRKKKKNVSDDMADCLTHADLNEKSAEVTRKSKRKKKESITEQETGEGESAKLKKRSKIKIKNEESFFEQEIDESICNVDKEGESSNLKKKSKNKKKVEESLIKQEIDESICSLDVKGNSLETSKKSKLGKKKKGNVNMLINGTFEHASYSETKGDSNMNKKSKKNLKSMSVKEETSTDIKLKEEIPKVIGKSKRKREESILSDANRSITYSPVQAVKKIKTEEKLVNKRNAVKRNNKGKQKKRYPM